MKKHTKAYDYVNPATGTRSVGIIEADTPAELREHMQAEMEASAGALTPANFTSPDLQAPLEPKQAPFVPKEEAQAIADKLAQANARLKAAGLPEVTVMEIDIAAPIEQGGVGK